MCRECIREDGWDKRIKLLRVKDHFICTVFPPSSASASTSTRTNPTLIICLRFTVSIESTGILPPNVLFEEAVKVFMAKCQTVLTELDNLNTQ
jgi:DNA-directed RNA polymerase I and III subunit RPAC1